MDTFADSRDLELIKQDKYTFAVLERILSSRYELLLTDHKSYIICHSEDPYPVWIWTADGLSDEIKETVWDLVMEHRPFSEGYKFNLKYELADYFIARSHGTDQDIHITTQMFAYDCPSPIAPEKAADGFLHCCSSDDIDEAAILHQRFFTEIGDSHTTLDQSRERVSSHIEDKEFFFWLDKNENTVACCDYQCSEGLAYVGCVYTIPEYRRRHYAENLVYQVTKLLSDMGLMPMLYTDAEYPASNACYRKIGYVLQGKLCTVSI